MLLKTTAQLSLDRNVRADGTASIAVLVTYKMIGSKKRELVYYPTGRRATKKLWAVIDSNKVGSDEVKEIRIDINQCLYRANKILRDNEFISRSKFEQEFLNTGVYHTLTECFEERVKEYLQQDRIGTAASVENSLNIFRKFAGKDEILFGEVTPAWLRKFEAWCLQQGRSFATVGIHTRNMRTVFNYAIDAKNIIKRESYPFGRYKFVPPSSDAFKRALTEQQKNKLLAYKCEGEAREALDYWIFSYFAWGMNFKDIALLKYKDIHPDQGALVQRGRAKTIRTQHKKTLLVIPYYKQLEEIVKRHGTCTLGTPDPEALVFNIINKDAPAVTRHHQLKAKLKAVNGVLKSIGALAFGFNITTYSARHTFATLLNDKGVSKNLIQQMMDHEEQKTTEAYFKSTITKEKKDIGRLLAA